MEKLINKLAKATVKIIPGTSTLIVTILRLSSMSGKRIRAKPENINDCDYTCQIYSYFNQIRRLIMVESRNHGCSLV
jgi:hypothetical protein